MITQSKNGRKEKIKETLKKEFTDSQADVLAEVITDAYNDLVKTSDFIELKNIVKELAEAQKRTEQRVEELAEAQKRTEQKVEELAEAQKRTEQRVEELAEAQKRTEQRVEELAEAQKRTEQKIEELAEAQKRTEQRVLALIDSHTLLKAQVGGLSHTVGYRLEDESYKALPKFLKDDFGIELIGKLKRDFIEIGKEKYLEVNIYGEGKINDKKYIIVGEAKTQLKKRDIDSFIKRADLLKQFITQDQIRLIVTYQASPQVRKYAKEKNIKIYFSYDF